MFDRFLLVFMRVLWRSNSFIKHCTYLQKGAPQGKMQLLLYSVFSLYGTLRNRPLKLRNVHMKKPQINPDNASTAALERPL